uniref:Uncharacterized protein n=1 Tax=Phasianus colchicus TaxID=9054 RepID=A0A669QQA3_PHACC
MAKLLSCVLGPRLYRVHRLRAEGGERREPSWVSWEGGGGGTGFW